MSVHYVLITILSLVSFVIQICVKNVMIRVNTATLHLFMISEIVYVVLKYVSIAYDLSGSEYHKERMVEFAESIESAN